jgi:hypothetical protein
LPYKYYIFNFLKSLLAILVYSPPEVLYLPSWQARREAYNLQLFGGNKSLPSSRRHGLKSILTN